MLLAVMLLLAAEAEAKPSVIPTAQSAWSNSGQMIVDGTGNVLSCKDELRGEKPDPASACEAFTKGAGPMLLRLRGGPGSKPVELIIEINIHPDGQPEQPLAYDRPGRTHSSLVSAHFTVDEQGKTQACAVDRKEGDPILQASDICTLFGTFLPPRDRSGRPVTVKARVTLAASTAPVP